MGATIQVWWDRANAALKPIADWFQNLQNAPVWVVGAIALGAIGFLWSRAAAAAKARRDAAREASRDREIEQLKQLTAAQTEQIERALAAVAPQLILAGGEGPQAAGANPKENLRAALGDFLKSDDARGAQVTALVEQKRTEEAAALSAAIAGEIEAEAKSIGADLNAKATKAWVDAGAVAYLNDPRSAVAAYEKARDLGADDAETHIWLGNLYWRLGRLDEAEASYRVAESRLAPDDQTELATILGNLGIVAMKRGDLAAAEDFLARALKLDEGMGSKEGIASTLGNLGIVADTRGDLAAAEDFYTRALKLNEVLDSKGGTARHLSNLGGVALTRGDLAAAEDLFTRALKLYEELSSKGGIASNLGNLGILAMNRGDLAAAEDFYKRALKLNEELGSKEGMANQLNGLGVVEVTRGNLAAAEDFYKRALKLNEEQGRKEGMANQLGNLGVVAEKRGDREGARALYQRALALFAEMGANDYEGAKIFRANLADLDE